nr:Fur family transcriptional regulator [Glycomyces mayteni]
MSDLVTRLRRHNWRITPQRRVIAETLEGSHVHFTADEVLERAVARMPELSRATVYNTLNEMVALGEVLELSLQGRSKRYDPNADHDHHHLICDGCGLMKDVHAVADPIEWLPGDERHGFTVTSAAVTYRGLCPDRRAASS